MEMRPGGFWRRFFAFAIDMAILCFVSLILFLTGLLAMGISGGLLQIVSAYPLEWEREMGLFAVLCFIAMLLAGMAYFTWFHGITGRTPGKKILGLRVVQTSGDPIRAGVAFLRWVGYLISGCFFGLGFLWIAFDREKQGWHDKIASTRVLFEQDGRVSGTDGNVGERVASSTAQSEPVILQMARTAEEEASRGPAAEDVAENAHSEDLSPKP